MKTNLRAYMLAHQISIRGLSEMTYRVTGRRVSTSTVQKALRGANVEIDVWQRIADALREPLVILIGDEIPPEENKKGPTALDG